jgi:hypothetical protein
MKRYRFQALVTPSPVKEGDPPAKLDSAAHRMVLRAKHSETRRSQVFSVLVVGDDDKPFRRESSQVVVTLNVIGDDVCDYLEIGSHFSLWNGSDVGQGVVTRRLTFL